MIENRYCLKCHKTTSMLEVKPNVFRCTEPGCTTIHVKVSYLAQVQHPVHLSAGGQDITGKAGGEQP